jgi:hypothetical protein
MPLYPPPFGLGNMQDQYPPSLSTYDTSVATASATTCAANGTPASYLVGIENASSSAQTATYTFYDNASVASGTVKYVCATPGPGQIITFAGPGIALANGCVCSPSGVAVGAGIIVTVR